MSDGNDDLGASMQGFLEELDAMPTAQTSGAALTDNAVAPGAQDLPTNMRTPTKQFLRVATDFSDEQRPMSSTPRSATSSFSSGSGLSPSSKKRRGRRPNNTANGGLDMYERSMLHLEERELKLRALEKTLLAECTFTPTSSTPNSRAGSRASSPTRGQVFDRLYAAGTAATRAQRSQRQISTPKSNGRSCSPMAGPRISAIHASGQKKLRARKKTAKEEEEALRKRREEEELAECTFTPQTKWRLAAERRKKARARAAHEEAEAVHKRTPRKIYSDSAARERRQKDKETEELQQCTFRPRLKWNITRERQGTPPSAIWDDDDAVVLPREISMRQTPSRTGGATRLSVSTIGTSASTLQKMSSSSLPPDGSPIRSTKMDFDGVDVKFVSTDQFKEESGKNIAPPPARSNYIGSVTPTQTEWKKRYDAVVKDKTEAIVSGEGSAPSNEMQIRGSSTIVAGGNKPTKNSPRASSSAPTATKTKTNDLDQELNDALESPLSFEKANTANPQRCIEDKAQTQLSTAASKESVDDMVSEKASEEATLVKGAKQEKIVNKGTKWHQRILGKRFGLSSTKQENTDEATDAANAKNEPPMVVTKSETEEERITNEGKESNAKQKEEEERLALEADNLSQTLTRIEARAGEAKQRATEEKSRIEAEAAQKAEDERLALEAEEARKRMELAAEESIQKAEKERLELEAEKERKRIKLEAEEAKLKAEKERLALEAETECKRIELAAEEAIQKAANERLALEKAEEERKKRVASDAKQKAEEEQAAWEAQEERKRIEAEEERKRLETEAKQKAEEEQAALDAHEERKRIQAQAEEAKRTAEDKRLALEAEEAKEKTQEEERRASLEAQWKQLAETEAEEARQKSEAARLSEEEKEEADLNLNVSGDHAKESVEVVSVIARNAGVGEGTVNSLAIGVSMDISEGVSTGVSESESESLPNQSFESVPSLSSENALRRELSAVLQTNENEYVVETEKGIEVECALEDDVTLKARRSEQRKLEHEVIQNGWNNAGLIGELTCRLEERKEETETQTRRVAEMEADLESRIRKEEETLSRSQHTSGSSESGLTSLDDDDNVRDGKKKKKSDRAKKWKARLKKKGMKSTTDENIKVKPSEDLPVKVAEASMKAEELIETNMQSSTPQKTETTQSAAEVDQVTVVSNEMTEEEKLQKKQQAMLALLAKANKDEDEELVAANSQITDEEKLQEKVQKKQQAMLALLAQAQEKEDEDLRLAAKLEDRAGLQSPEEVRMKANENAMLNFLAQAKEEVGDSSTLVAEAAASPCLKDAYPIIAPSDSVESFPTPEPVQTESVEESADYESTDDDEPLVGGDEKKKKKKSSDRAKKWKDRLAKKTKGDSKRKKETSDALSDAATAGGDVEKEVFPRVVYSDKDTNAIKEPAIGSI